MERLTSDDAKRYLQSGALTGEFLDSDFVIEKIEIDYNNKIATNKNHTKLDSIFSWIWHNVKMAEDEKFIRENKFQRTAGQVWESGQAVGCFDFANVFATVARQVGIPTTILATAEERCFKRVQKEDVSVLTGHYFCECFIDGKWVLVDPTCKKIENNYSPSKIKLHYRVGESNKFIPYQRCVDLGEKKTIKQHNEEMIQMCRQIGGEKQSREI